jgi:hypothetical protein
MGIKVGRRYILNRRETERKPLYGRRLGTKLVGLHPMTKSKVDEIEGFIMQRLSSSRGPCTA